MGRHIRTDIKQKPLIVICSEGGKNSSEQIYFRNLRNRNLRVEFSTGNNTDPEGMVRDLKKYIENNEIYNETNCKIYLIIDTDYNINRVKRIRNLFGTCWKNNIEIITSSPAFEIWYLMHFRNYSLNIITSKGVKEEMNKYIDNYCESMDIYPYIIDKQLFAIKTAKSFEEKSIKFKDDLYLYNPHSSVYRVLEYALLYR